MSTRAAVHGKILVPPPLKSLSKMGTLSPPNGGAEAYQGAGAYCTKGASRAAGGLREKDILLCSVSFFCVCKTKEQ